MEKATAGNEAATERHLLTVADVARYLVVTERKVRAEVKAGRLACVRVGARSRFTPEQIQAYIDQQSVTAVNPYARTMRSRRRAAS